MNSQILALGAALVTLPVAALPVPAAAAEIDLQCVGSHATTYSPGLLLNPQTVTISSNTIFAPCTSLTDPSITAGSISFAVQHPASCALFFNGSASTQVITWNTGETSTWFFTSSVNVVGGVVTFLQTGAITDGKFTGATAVGTAVLLTLPVVNCLAPPGVTSVQGPQTIAIFQP